MIFDNIHGDRHYCYISKGGPQVGFIDRHRGGFYMFISEYPLIIENLTEVTDKMKELEGIK